MRIGPEKVTLVKSPNRVVDGDVKFAEVQRIRTRGEDVMCDEVRVLAGPQQINAGRGIGGNWESNPYLCATVQDFPKHVCAPINQSTYSIQSDLKETYCALQNEQGLKISFTKQVPLRSHPNAFISLFTYRI
jgi:hypothetical protein